MVFVLWCAHSVAAIGTIYFPASIVLDWHPETLVDPGASGQWPKILRRYIVMQIQLNVQE